MGSQKQKMADITSEMIPIPVEVIARNLFDVGFKYTWKIEDYLKGVDGEIDVDSQIFHVRIHTM